MSVIKNYEEVIERLKPHLIDYLEDQGLNPRKNFSCLHPDHGDSGPSMSIMPDRLRAKCFGCGELVDIFDACHFLEDRPQNGPTFIMDNVMYLAEKFGIEVELKELTEEEKYRLETYNAYKHAALYVASHPSPAAITEMRNRGWEPNGCKDRLIGSVETFGDYKNHMKSLGYAVSFLEAIDLLNPQLFSEENLIFTVSDEYGRPVGFGARNLTWVKGSKSPKYINTSAKCVIYEKSKRLYNIHNAKKNPGTLYVTEGYADAESMIQNGIEKVVCVGGTAFTDYHVIELARLNQTDVTLLLDGDEAGVKSASSIIEKFASHRDFALKIIVLPDDQDPDDFLRSQGKSGFYELKVWTAFEWKINSYDDRIDTVLIRREIVPIIAAEPSPIERDNMARVLSARVGISIDAIKEEIEQILNENEHNRKIERDRIINKIVTDLKSNPNDWRLTLSEATSSLETVSEKYNEDTFSPTIFIKELEDLRNRELDPEASGMSFTFNRWRQFNEAINGNHEATLNVIGGVANAGKTALMSCMALQLADNYDEDNFVLFHTIDDTLEQFSSRLICQLARRKYIDINLGKIKNPNGYPDAQRIHEARNWAYDYFFKLIREKRILVRGGESSPNAATLTYGEEMIKYAKKVRPGARIIYFGDNFHRYRDFQGSDERTRFKKLSNAAKDMAKRYNIPCWVTMEYNKTVGTGRPTNNSISESIAMEYDANFIMHLYSDWHSAIQEGTDPKVFFQRQLPNGHFEKQPRIEAIIGKNKISSFKGSIFFDFYADQSYMEEVSRAVVEQEKQAAERAYKEAA